jgi:hypothetical protein
MLVNYEIDSLKHLGVDCKPCLTLPEYGPRNWQRQTGTVYGGNIKTFLDNCPYSVFTTGYWLPLIVQCTDNSIDTDQDGIVDCADNCPWKSNPNQSDCDGNGTGNAYDCDINLTPSKSNILHNEQATILTNGCGSADITWTVTTEDGVEIKSTQSSNLITITALSGQGSITIEAQSTDPNCNDTTTIHVECNSCTGGYCETIKY